MQLTEWWKKAIGGVEFVGVNTDKQALTLCKAPTVLQIGEKDYKKALAPVHSGSWSEGR